MNIRHSIKKIWLFVSYPIRKNYIATKCGHVTKKSGVIKEGNNNITMQMPLNKNGNPDYCLACIEKMQIKCAWCGEPISIGDRITLYLPKIDFKTPPYAKKHEESGETALVGCLRWNCALSGADMCGTWIPPGKVERFISPLEMCIAVNQDPGKNSKKMIVVNDLKNYPQSASLLDVIE